MDPTSQRLLAGSAFKPVDRDTQVVVASFAITTIGGGTRFGAYQWTNSGGFGTKYADAATALSVAPASMQPTTANDAVVFVTTASPFLYAYEFDFDTGWGAVESPSTIPNGTGPDSLLRHPEADEFIMNTSTEYYITKYNTSSNFTFVESGLVPQTNCTSLGMIPSGNVVAFGASISPRLTAKEYTLGSGLGVSYSDPAVDLVDQVNRISWSPDSSFISVTHRDSPFFSTYDWSNGFGTKYNPTAPAGTTQQCYGSIATNSAVIHGYHSSPFIFAYPFTAGSGYGAAFSNPSVLPANDVRGLCFNQDYSVLFVGAQTSTTAETLTAYEWSDSTGFGTKYANPSPVVSGTVANLTVINGKESRRGFGL